MKKLFKNVVDLTLRQRSKKSNANGMSGGSCGHRPPWWLVCVEDNTNIYQKLLNTACGLLGSDGVSWWKICLSADGSTNPHHQDCPAVVGRILDSGGLPAIFAILEPEGLPYPENLAGECSGYASHISGHLTSFQRRGIGPASSRRYLQDLPSLTYH